MVRLISDVADAPKAIGPYSQAVTAAGLVFISGQVPIDPASGNICGEGIEEQTTQVLKNLSAILKHLKLDFTHVVQSRIYLTSLNTFQTVNSIYEKALGGHRPARATIEVSALPKGAKVEIEMVAAIEK
jgi:2-iminobutanoate/2-iminopropanoate deaminase